VWDKTPEAPGSINEKLKYQQKKAKNNLPENQRQTLGEKKSGRSKTESTANRICKPNF
jgi:hypothetical protein